jgi:FkbM family methyltransferase
VCEFGHISLYKDFVEKLQSRKLVLFGAGGDTPNTLNHHFRYDDVHAIWDNNPAKQGKKIFGIAVSPPALETAGDEYVVLITTSDELAIGEIAEQLNSASIKHVYPQAILGLANVIERYNADFSKKFHELNSFRLIEDNIGKIKRARDLLADEKSRYVYDAIVEKTKYNIGDYTDVCDDVYDHYFSGGFFEYGDREVLIDGGAFLGEDAIRFARLVGRGNIRRIYCFEPDMANYLKCVRNLQKFFDAANGEDLPDCHKSDKFAVCKSGLWHENSDVGFISYGRNDSVFAHLRNAASNESIPAVRLDDAVDPADKVTLIKMDIEGAESHALQGASQLIRRDKPKLAICIYHMIEDLWAIPLYIHSLVPEYKLYVRHHTAKFWDSVVYATI